MFDGSSFEMPSMPVSEPAPEPKEGLGVTPEQMAELAEFFEKQLENSHSKLIPLMADAEQNGAWDLLALEINKGKGMNFSAEQLEAAMKGSGIFKRATEMALEEPEPEGEDVDVSDLDKAA